MTQSKYAVAMSAQRDLVGTAKRKAKPLTPEDLEAMTSDPKTKDKYKLLALVMFFSAARVSEAIGLQWHAVDWQRGTITRPVLKATKGKRIDVKGPRNGHYITSSISNRVELPDLVLNEIQELRHKLGDPGDDAFMFSNGRGWHVSKQAVSKQLERMASRQGWDSELVSSHSFRRGWATYAVAQAGYSVQQAMEVTGHKSQQAFYEYVDMV